MRSPRCLSTAALPNSALQQTGFVGRWFASLTGFLWRPQLNADTLARLGCAHGGGRGPNTLRWPLSDAPTRAWERERPAQRAARGASGFW